MLLGNNVIPERSLSGNQLHCYWQKCHNGFICCLEIIYHSFTKYDQRVI